MMIQRTKFTEFDQQCMQHAIALAQQAAVRHEVPVGAVLALDRQIMASGYNQPIGQHDPTAHAEIIALRAAGIQLNNYRLPDTTMYVTLEPCPMCLSAMIHARVQRLVFACSDLRTGACGGAINLSSLHPWNHKIIIESGLYATECSTMLQDFFRQRR